MLDASLGTTPYIVPNSPVYYRLTPNASSSPLPIPTNTQIRNHQLLRFNPAGFETPGTPSEEVLAVGMGAITSTAVTTFGRADLAGIISAEEIAISLSDNHLADFCASNMHATQEQAVIRQITGVYVPQATLFTSEKTLEALSYQQQTSNPDFPGSFIAQLSTQTLRSEAVRNKLQTDSLMVIDGTKVPILDAEKAEADTGPPYALDAGKFVCFYGNYAIYLAGARSTTNQSFWSSGAEGSSFEALNYPLWSIPISELPFNWTDDNEPETNVLDFSEVAPGSNVLFTKWPNEVIAVQVPDQFGSYPSYQDEESFDGATIRLGAYALENFSYDPSTNSVSGRYKFKVMPLPAQGQVRNVGPFYPSAPRMRLIQGAKIHDLRDLVIDHVNTEQTAQQRSMWERALETPASGFESTTQQLGVIGRNPPLAGPRSLPVYAGGTRTINNLGFSTFGGMYLEYSRIGTDPDTRVQPDYARTPGIAIRAADLANFLSFDEATQTFSRGQSLYSFGFTNIQAFQIASIDGPRGGTQVFRFDEFLSIGPYRPKAFINNKVYEASEEWVLPNTPVQSPRLGVGPTGGFGGTSGTQGYDAFINPNTGIELNNPVGPIYRKWVKNQSRLPAFTVDPNLYTLAGVIRFDFRPASTLYVRYLVPKYDPTQPELYSGPTVLELQSIAEIIIDNEVVTSFPVSARAVDNSPGIYRSRPPVAFSFFSRWGMYAEHRDIRVSKWFSPQYFDTTPQFLHRASSIGLPKFGFLGTVPQLGTGSFYDGLSVSHGNGSKVGEDGFIRPFLFTELLLDFFGPFSSRSASIFYNLDTEFGQEARFYNYGAFPSLFPDMDIRNVNAAAGIGRDRGHQSDDYYTPTTVIPTDAFSAHPPTPLEIDNVVVNSDITFERNKSTISIYCPGYVGDRDGVCIAKITNGSSFEYEQLYDAWVATKDTDTTAAAGYKDQIESRYTILVNNFAPRSLIEFCLRTGLERLSGATYGIIPGYKLS
jgi:hypothetical protein